MKKVFSEAKNHLMTGVSYMIPFIVAGGLIMTIGLLMGGGNQESGLAKTLVNIGVMGMSFMVPMLSGYISYSIADRTGIAPGMIGGLIANELGAGFLGGILSGFVAGYVVNLLKRIPMHRNLAQLKPIIIIPFFGTIIVAGIMYLLGGPIALLSSTLEGLLVSLQGGSLFVLGFVIAAMMAVDMGGPVNKIAFAFCAAMIDKGIYEPMAACWIGIMAPPIGLALATMIAPKKFLESEKTSALSITIMGLTGITEGAIPFAAVDPLHVIPSIVVGSGIGGALALLFGSAAPVPSGGIFVVPFFQKPLFFVIALIIACVAIALLTAFLKKESSEVTE